MSDLITPPPLPNKRQYRRLLIACAVIFGLGVATALVVLGSVRWRWHSNVKQQLSKAKQSGLPTTAAELNAWYAAIPASNNAALFYEDLFRKMSTNQLPGSFPSLRRDEPLSESVSNQLRKIVTVNSQALELARRGTALKQARYSIDLRDGMNAKLPHLAKLKALSQILRAEALLLTIEGKSMNAVESILAIHRAARTLDDEPVLVSPLVALAMDANGFSALERLLNHSALDERQLVQLSNAAAGADRTNRFVKGLIADRAIFNEIIGMAQYDIRKLQNLSPSEESDETAQGPTVQPGMGWHLIGFFERDRAFYLRAMETNIAVAKLTPPTSFQATQSLEQLNTQARNGFHIFSSMLLPAISRLSVRDAEGSSRARTAIAALAMERWRATHSDNLPDSFDELVLHFLTAMPIDPFNGQRIRYTKLAHGYAVYSVGKDGHDDGGKEQPPRGTKLSRSERERYDITFVVAR